MSLKNKGKKEAEEEVDPAEAKRIRKAAKRAAAEAAAAEEEEPEVDPAEAKKARKAAKRAAAAAAVEEEEPEVDPAEAKKARKAAKRAAAEAAAEEEEDPVEAKRRRKEEKRKAKADAEAEEEEVEAPKQNGGNGSAEEDYTVFIRGLPFSAEEPAVKKDFMECGEIESFSMPVNAEGRPRGIAFVKYVNKAGLDAALKFDGSDYGGRYLEVKQALAKGEGKGKGDKGDKGNKGEKGDKGKGKGKDFKGDSTTNSDFALFVGGLPFHVDEATLRPYFEECGEVSSIRMPKYEDGSFKGIAFVRFTCEEDTEKAVALSGKDIEGRNITVRRATDTPRDSGKGKDDKGKGKDGKGKDGKGKDGKGKGKGKSKAPSESFAKSSGCIVASTAAPKTFDDSDEE